MPKNKNTEKIMRTIYICRSTGCNSSGAEEIEKELLRICKKKKVQVNIKPTGCLGFCQMGPVMIVEPDHVFYVLIKAKDAEEIVESHLINNNIIERLLYKDPDSGQIIQNPDEIKFYKSQQRLVTKRYGKINPEIIEDYIDFEGYQAIKKAIEEFKPDEIIEELKKSGLRGRGGAGFSTGMKWSFLKNAKPTPKYLICNCDEGDPGAFMDMMTMESDPHAIIEGMILGAYAIKNINDGYVYIRAEYPLAIKRLKIALQQAREHGYLGKNILNSGLDFDIHIKEGAGAFVCGEETALMASIMGNRGNPTPRPPYPAQKGLWGQPSNINNVKSYATVPQIILKGADWYNKIGTTDSKGTAIIALSGKINNSGLVEIPMGTSIKQLIFDIGGGCPNGKEFKAIQVGGPSGGCIPAKYIETSIDYEHLTELGAIMGSGGLIVLDQDSCMVEVARFFLDFTQDESCGKCTPCRIGTRKLSEILTKITEGKGELEDLDKLLEISKTISNMSLCGLGQTAPNPVLTTLKYFRNEYEAHINGKCPALVCKALIKYTIDKEKCTGCGVCKRACPVNAISGKKKMAHSIDSDICTRCGLCYSSCNFDAIYKTTGDGC